MACDFDHYNKMTKITEPTLRTMGLTYNALHKYSQSTMFVRNNQPCSPPKSSILYWNDEFTLSCLVRYE